MIGDNALVQLRFHTQLEKLSLSGTNITDAGLTHLRDLRNLFWLDLSCTETTCEAREELGSFLKDNPIIH